MQRIRRIKIILSKDDLKNIEVNKNTGYSIVRLNTNKYKLELNFKIIKRQIQLNINAVYTLGTEDIIIDKIFYGTTDVFSLIDKVYCLNPNSNDINILMKIELGDDLKSSFATSVFASNNVNNYGSINLYNHILYTDFLNNIELIELCYKYASFCLRVINEKSITEVLELLDKGLYKIDTSFQEKLEYYGYRTVTEVKESLESYNLDERISKETKTKDEIVKKIVLLTQCLFETGKYSSLMETLAKKILDETSKYMELITNE